MIVLSYDVDTTDAAGAKRLRKVAKICEAKGCRVQNSVFELLVDPAQLTTLKAQLEKVIDPEKDSVRFYLYAFAQFFMPARCPPHGGTT